MTYNGTVGAADLVEFQVLLMSLGYDPNCDDGECGGPCLLLEHYTACEGDLNGDAMLDELDYQKIQSNLGLTFNYDINPGGPDGCVDILDLGVILNLNGVCGNDDSGNYNPIYDYDCDGCITFGADGGILIGNYSPQGCEPNP